MDEDDRNAETLHASRAREGHRNLQTLGGQLQSPANGEAARTRMTRDPAPAPVYRGRGQPKQACEHARTKRAGNGVEENSAAC